ncbi:hypothetical protein, partial [uncultured Ruthenibacterium sp.]|uniref:hypothetical protein n=1 Tax=uncultured Ruthenibacterium sp. TaxID=1905347 RepID=UPI00349EC822
APDKHSLSAAPVTAEEEPEPLVMTSGNTNDAGFFSFYYDPAHSELGNRLTRWDWEDMTVHICCTVPGCDHMGQACEARRNGYLSVLENAVYTLEQEKDGSFYTLYQWDSQGLHPQPVGQMDYWSFFGADAEYLYGFCDKAFGRVSRANGEETLLAYSLRTDFYDRGSVLGVWENRFVAVSLDPDRAQPARVCLFDREGNVTEVAQIDANRFANQRCALVDSEVVYLDRLTGDVMSVSLDTGETRTVTQALRPYNTLEKEDFYNCQRWSVQVVGNTPVVGVMDRVQNGSNTTVFRVNEDGTATELPQRQQLLDFDSALWPGFAPNGRTDPVTVLAQWKGRLAVLCAIQFSAIQTETGPSQHARNVYAGMDAEDYLAGKEIYREFTVPD